MSREGPSGFTEQRVRHEKQYRDRNLCLHKAVMGVNAVILLLLYCPHTYCIYNQAGSLLYITQIHSAYSTSHTAERLPAEYNKIPL